MLTVDERKIMMHEFPIYKGLTILFGIVIAVGVITAMVMSNSASTMLQGSSFSSFLGARVNEKVSLGIFFMTGVACLLIFVLRSMYFAAKTREIPPVL